MRPLAIASLLAVCACAAPPPYAIQASFNRDQIAWIQSPGTGAIKGQAFLKTVGGDVKTCAGNIVVLLPSSAYTREIVSAGMSASNRSSSIANLNEGLASYMKGGRCDAQGNFSVARLPAGDYIILTEVTWGVPRGNYGVSREGGPLTQEISLAMGEEKQVILSR